MRRCFIMPENTFNERPHKNEKQESIAYVKALIEQARNDAREDDIPKLEKLIELLNSKKYGLVWERHEEIVEEEMKTKIPVFVEDESKKIHDNPDSEDYNFLLEGDNLHSLHLLEKTHTGKIDVIYIDPPYNTGNKDFKYNDKFVDNTDTFSHSKWLSFMERRLTIAKSLLSDDGVIFISIDDNEQSQLKLLMDEIFGEKNFVANIVRQAIKGGSRAVNIKSVHDYVAIYAKNILQLTPFTGHEKEKLAFNLKDEKGEFLRGRELNKWGAGSRREDSPSMWFPIVGPNGEKVYPIRNDGSEGRWRWGKKKLLKAVEENEVIFELRDNGTYVVYEKVRGLKNENEQFTTWFSDQYINAKGSDAVKKLFNTLMSVFNFAKPVELVKDLIFMANKPNGIFLDFFAGSGTTGQAVVELNAEDGGHRKFILATNNENNIAEEVTYERIKRVSVGTEKYTAHSMNLKYFKTDFVVKEDFPDASLEYELLKYVTPLVELEFAIDITNPKVQIVLNEEQLESLIANDELVSNSTLFMHPDVFRDAEQNQILSDLQIKVQEIPDYFFGGEMWRR